MSPLACRHIPVGVLHDLLASSQEEPWHLTVGRLSRCPLGEADPITHNHGRLMHASCMQIHFRAFPADVLLRWEGEQTLRAAHFNSMKV